MAEQDLPPEGRHYILEPFEIKRIDNDVMVYTIHAVDSAGTQHRYQLLADHASDVSVMRLWQVHEARKRRVPVLLRLWRDNPADGVTWIQEVTIHG